MKAISLYTILFILLAIIPSCKKYLDAKPDKTFSLPQTLFDLQTLLDNEYVMNCKSPSMDEGSTTDYYMPYANYLSRAIYEQKFYTWTVNGEDLTAFPDDWSLIYEPVYVSNVVLDNLGNITKDNGNANSWNNIKGAALFYRAFSFFRGLVIFSNAFDSATMNTDAGVPLRLSSDFNTQTTRPSVKETLDKILGDLKEAATLLPDLPIKQTRPSKNSVYALLSRIYLHIRNYDSSYKYADLSLRLNSKLLNYNNLNATAVIPFQRLNDEVIFHSMINGYMVTDVYPTTGFIDSTLFKSYESNDIRSTIYFQFIRRSNAYYFKGTYDGSSDRLFTGLANDELYLTRAECYVRKGEITNALQDLTTLLKNRYKTNSYSTPNLSDAGTVLQLILSERRKELLFRGVRWMDLKRLNKEGANITLTRVVNGITYTLPPNSKRYALPIPVAIIKTTGISQNNYN